MCTCSPTRFERLAVGDGLAVDGVAGGQPHPHVVPRRLRVPLVEHADGRHPLPARNDQPDARGAPGFLTAEIVEVFEAAINNGWDCAVTNGESLSRVLAFERHPEIAAEFNQTEQDWWAQGHRDYVNDNSAGDTDQIAAGCGDLFLYYLHAQLTFDWTTVCGAGGPTLGATYQSLTGYDPQQGFNDFVAALSTIDQGGTLALPPSGNPFPIKT